MNLRATMALLAVLALGAYASAQTWTDSIEFNSADDYDSGIDTVFTELDVALGPADTEGGSSNIVVGGADNEDDDGYLRILNDGEKRGYGYTPSPGFITSTGYTVEWRMRFDESRDNKGARDFQMRLWDDIGRKYVNIGAGYGTDDVSLASESPNVDVWSWDPAVHGTYGGTLIEKTSDWHVYRIVHDPNKASNKTELWIDGTLIVEADLPPKSPNSQLKFGMLKGNTEEEVWIDYIRWALGQPVAPSGPGLAIPQLQNARFDNISDPDGPTGGAPIAIARWDSENISGPGVVDNAYTEVLRCNLYGKAVRHEHGEAHDAVLKQTVSTGINVGDTIDFSAKLRGFSADCVPLQGRVGVDPTGTCGLIAGNPNVVWGNWVELYDVDLCSPLQDCVEATVTGVTAQATSICVIIETKADNSPTTEQSTFYDGASLTVTPNEIVCNTPRQDADGDGDVDVADFTAFQLCFNGPDQPWPGPPIDQDKCACLDSDPSEGGSDPIGDGDVDVTDFIQFQTCFNGPDQPPAC